MKKHILTPIILFFVATAFAQGSDDANLFSQTFYQGTAKGLGMGNALGAVGGDMTAVCINPAGMGIYRSNEFTTSLNVLDNYQRSTYYGTNNGINKMRLSIPNFGYVSASQRSNYRKLRFTQYGIGLTRTNDFNIHTYAQGLNPTSSKIDDYLSQIDGLSAEDIQDMFPNTIYPAWQTYLIDLYEDEQGLYYSSPVPQGGIMQAQENHFKGRSEEWTFAASANYAERLFIGASFGIQYLKRVGVRAFEESMPKQSDIETDFNQWTYTEDIESRGLGINGKLGLIYQANAWMRLGASYHTPAIYSFDESWQTQTESQISHITRKHTSQESNYEYTFFSPQKWVVSMAFIFGQRGLLSFDAEYTNFGAARFTDPDWDYSDVNADIKETYGRTLNFRIGSEWRVNGSYVRLGAAYYGSPFGLGNANGSAKKASCGISVPVSEDTTFDFAYELTYGKTGFYLYDAGGLGIEPVTQRQFKSNLAGTLKVRF